MFEEVHVFQGSSLSPNEIETDVARTILLESQAINSDKEVGKACGNGHTNGS